MRTSAPRALALRALLVLASLLLVSRPALTQAAPAKPATTMDHGAMNHGEMNRGNMSHMSGWKAMDDFHGFMMASWHPVKDNGNFAPARSVAAGMAEKAEAWAKAPVPGYCGAGTSAAISRIAADSRAFARLVEAKATDAKLKDALSALHDSFEKVEKGCPAPAAKPATPPSTR